MPARIAERISRGRPITGPHRDPSERGIQRLEKILAEARAGFDREVGVLGNVRPAVEIRDLAMEEIAEEERAGQANTTQLLE